jgi:Plavaka transposase
MTEKFILVTRNICCLLHKQIACADFNGHWDYVPYKEFNSAGEHVWSNLMSGEWAAKQVVCGLSLILLLGASQQTDQQDQGGSI